MKEHIHILQHALGLDRYGQGKRYRNHFVTGEGSSDFDACRALASAGLMIERPASELTGGSPVFFVSADGIAFVERESEPLHPLSELLLRQINN